MSKLTDTQRRQRNLRHALNSLWRKTGISFPSREQVHGWIKSGEITRRDLPGPNTWEELQNYAEGRSAESLAVATPDTP